MSFERSLFMIKQGKGSIEGYAESDGTCGVKGKIEWDFGPKDTDKNTDRASDSQRDSDRRSDVRDDTRNNDAQKNDR